MTVVYHVETHKNPRQIERLASTLVRWAPDALVVIDHDRGFESPDRALMARLGVELRLSDGGYGDMSHVNRWFRTAQWLEDEGISYDWLSNLTGQDYPTRPLGLVHDDLARSGADAFVQTFAVLDPDETRWGVARGRTRYEFRHHRLRRLTAQQQRWLRPVQAVNLIQPWFRITTSTGLAWGVRERSPWGPELELRGGSFFGTLGRRAVQAVLRFAGERPDVAAFLSGSIAPDEVYLQTALGWAQGQGDDLRVVNDCRRYFDFSESTFNHPRTFSIDDLPRVLASGADFARKFDEASHPGVLEALDAHLERMAAEAPA